IRRTLVSRSSLLKPSPLLRLVRTSSPSSTSGRRPRAASSVCNRSAIVRSDPPDVGVAVLFAETQSLAEIGAHLITVEHLGATSQGCELCLQPLGDCQIGSAGRWCRGPLC